MRQDIFSSTPWNDSLEKITKLEKSAPFEILAPKIAKKSSFKPWWKI